MDDTSGIAYDAALRELDKQERVVDELRSRTGVLLAASALVASFLGERALLRGDRSLVIGALVAFGLSTLLSLYILTPRPQLAFAVSAKALIGWLELADPAPATVQLALAQGLVRLRESNDNALRALRRGFQLSAWALLAETVLLLASLGSTLE